MNARVAPRARTIFLGTGPFAVPIASALSDDANVELVAVVTAPQRIGSRGKVVDPPVAQWSAERSIPLVRPERLRAAESVADLARLAPDLLILADYGQIVPASVLDLPRHGALNLHPSLLPRHRGATPIPSAILEGDSETGVTLMRMDVGLDRGPIVAQWRTALSGSETAPELEAALADKAARLLTATLGHWLAGEITPEPQADKGATLTRPLRRTDGRLDPMKPVAQLARQVRAYQPWPGSYVDTDAGRHAIWAAHEAEAGGERGESSDIGTLVAVDGGQLGLRVSDGTLVIDDVQPAGGRRMTSAELVRGRPMLVGARVVAPADAGS